ncbi:MAG: N-acetyltransferase family protein [Planctomycetota bacterium]
MTFTIRLATADDVPLIRQLIADLAEFEKLAHEMVATDELLHEHLFGARPAAEVQIGECDGEPVAFCLFFTNFSTFLGRPGIYLEDLFVRPSHRGRGFGEALLRNLARLAVERGCGRLEWSVLDWNENAVRFYRRLGAKPMSEWTVMRVTGDALQRLGGGD